MGCGGDEGDSPGGEERLDNWKVPVAHVDFRSTRGLTDEKGEARLLAEQNATWLFSPPNMLLTSHFVFLTSQ